MRQGQNSKRPRGRGGIGGNSGGGRRNPPGRSQTHDSNGPNIRIRGNASQVYEKYLVLARDAYTAGDRIAAENYFQHADHYFRIFNADSGGDSQGRGRDHGGAQRNGDGHASDEENGRFDAADAPQPHIEQESQLQPQTEMQSNGSDMADTDEVAEAGAEDVRPAPKRRGRPPGRSRAPRAAAGTNGGDATADTDGASPAAED